MLQTTNHLTLKQAAHRLGVHEQTLRSWEKRGLIRMIRLPGSRYRRVPLAEVERLQAEMLAGSPHEGVRLVPPQGDPDAMATAQALAKMVRAELATLESTYTLDQFMAESRGRAWSP